MDEILAYSKVGAVPAAIVAGEAGWPMTWYVRKAPVNWEMPTPDRQAPIVICDLGQADQAAKILGPGFQRTDVPFRGWWIPETSLRPLHPSFGEILRYFFTRTVWQGNLEKSANPIGSVYVAVFRRVEPPPAPASPPPQPPATPPS